MGRREAAQGAQEATASRERAERDLARTKAQTPDVAALAARLRGLREQNNFAAAIAATIGKDTR
ncbi:DUF7620 family protein [Nocardioides terrisoli]|uniref:DUF7620 family protein n=1 Tax=Nocardioides terrisoli TaxID=3388267 RepID=UPI00287BBECE|nr:hypothetical protein [Nocardioides marmorisolisilvae]